MDVRAWIEQQVEIAVSGEDDILRQRMHIVNVLAPTITKLVEALRESEAHLEELREAWERGCIRETDGLGGTRSNRNWDALKQTRAALGANMRCQRHQLCPENPRPEAREAKVK